MLVALGAGVLSALLSIWWQQSYWVDLNLPLCSSRLLLSGKDPYAACYTDYNGNPSASYPLTTVLAFLPFALLPGAYLGVAVLWGVFNGLLAFGLFKQGKPWLFLVFLSAPYWASFAFHQFSPLMAAVYLLPGLLPLALLKPQIGLPVILSRLTRRRLVALLVFLGLTFLVYPGWLKAWLASARNYDGVIPLLIFPLGLLLLLALIKFRDPGARFLLLMACMPQRSIYDTTALYLLPSSLRQMLFICFMGWLAFLPPFLASDWKVPASEVRLSLYFVYLPLTLLLLLGRTAKPADLAGQPPVE